MSQLLHQPSYFCCFRPGRFRDNCFKSQQESFKQHHIQLITGKHRPIYSISRKFLEHASSMDLTANLCGHPQYLHKNTNTSTATFHILSNTAFYHLIIGRYTNWVKEEEEEEEDYYYMNKFRSPASSIFLSQTFRSKANLFHPAVQKSFLASLFNAPIHQTFAFSIFPSQILFSVPWRIHSADALPH